MSGEALKNYLKKRGVKMGELAAGLGIKQPSLNDRFATEPKITFIKEISEITGIPAADLIAAAMGDGDNSTTGMVNEPVVTYGTHKKPDLKGELTKVYAENVKLHATLADRGNFIIQLLNQ